jgi:hypothetical protein
VNEQITLSCKFGELQPHDKGLQFDFITTAKVGGEVVMESLTTYLSRQKTEKKLLKNRKNLKSLHISQKQNGIFLRILVVATH